MLEINQKAPDFILEDADGNKHSLSDYLGKKVILYFYPKDNTSGCTAQACSFSELRPQYEEKNAVIIGISKDNKKSHRKFIDNYNLDILLLSNEELDVIQAYDVWKEKTNYGKKYMGVVRTTYVIDEKGIIIHAFDKVNANQNAKEMLEVI